MCYSVPTSKEPDNAVRYYTVTMQSGHTYMPFARDEAQAMEYAQQLAWNIHGVRDIAVAAVVGNAEWTRL